MPAIGAPASSGQTALTLFFGLMKRWNVADVDRQATLLGVSDRTVRRYAQEAPASLDRDTRERISHLMNLHLDLRGIFASNVDVDRWLTSPNEDFGGQSPLNRLLAGNVSDIIDVRYYVQGMNARS